LTHLHLTVIILTILLFLVAVSLQKQGKNIKALQMILRVMYLLIIATGGMLFLSVYKITFLYVLKATLGLLMIGLFEMILSFGGKRKSSLGLWVTFAVVLMGIVYLGLKLPMGFYFN
jgi:hypothetical protein